MNFSLQGFSQLEVKELAPCDVYSLGASVLELAYGRALSCSDAEYGKVRQGEPVTLAGKQLCPLQIQVVLPLYNLSLSRSRSLARSLARALSLCLLTFDCILSLSTSLFFARTGAGSHSHRDASAQR